jgi:hypothetical protein
LVYKHRVKKSYEKDRDIFGIPWIADVFGNADDIL